MWDGQIDLLLLHAIITYKKFIKDVTFYIFIAFFFYNFLLSITMKAKCFTL